MSIGSEDEFQGMVRAGNVVSETLGAMKAAVRPGISTGELDAIGLAIFEKYGAVSAPQVFYDFPKTTLISINDEVVHGIPGERLVEAGDGWTVKTVDGSVAAHFEHTLVITKGKPIVLTAA